MQSKVGSFAYLAADLQRQNNACNAGMKETIMSCKIGRSSDVQTRVSSCTDVGMARLRSTSSTVAHQWPMLSAGSVSGQPHSNWWWCRDISYPLLDAAHSLCTAPWSGIPCRTTFAHSRTESFRQGLKTWLFSRYYSVFSVLETFVIIALYKSTYHTILFTYFSETEGH